MVQSFRKFFRFRNKSTLFLLILLLFLVGVIAAGSIYFKDDFFKTNNSARNEVLLKKWRAEIGGNGGVKAYQKFKDEVADLSVFDQHFLAHFFGTALYQTEGLSGISDCDTSFSYGCYHAYLGTAIEDRGLQIIPTLNQWCFNSFSSGQYTCQHGIGHGLMNYLGYDLKDLNKALEICSNLANADPIIGCFGGVFMEYNLRTMLLNEVPARSFSQASAHTPCNEIDPKWARACYYQQPSWWLETMPFDWSEKVRQSGILCSSIENKSVALQCYKGIGLDLVMRINADEKSAIKMCGSLPDKKAVILCQAGVGKSLINNKMADLGLKICDNLAGDEYTFCKKELAQVRVTE